MMLRVVALLTLCLNLGLLPMRNAAAHTGGTTGFATITISGQTVSYRLSLTPSSITPQLADAMHLGQPGFAPIYDPLLEAVEAGIHVANRGAACALGNGSVSPPAGEGAPIVIALYFACADALTELTLRDDLFDTLGADYHTLAKIEWSGGNSEFAFQADAREVHVAVSAPSTARGPASFFPLGVKHILIGFDHLLFLLALILRGGNLWSLLKIVTAFTLAHSITLALAALNIVTLPDRFVEATIALSIAYVAAENVLMRNAVSHRWVVSFLFGLVHGFGFSSVLRELALPRSGLLAALLSFNLGVETGQALAILAVLPLLIWLRRATVMHAPWGPRAIPLLSSAVLVIGILLFFDRLIGA